MRHLLQPTCENCREPSWELFCEACRPLLTIDPQKLCLACGSSHEPHCQWSEFQKLKGLSATFLYEGGVRTWIQSIKQHRQPERWRELRLQDLPPWSFNPQALAVVPSDPQHRRERFFDCSEVLAQHLSRMLNLPVIRPFVRESFLYSQKEMTRAHRLRWLRRCYRLSPKAPFVSRLLLVDDVMTSAASILRSLELLMPLCDEIVVYCVARTLARADKINDK